MTARSTPVVLFTNSPFMGGMEEHLQVLARGLVARGVPVALMCSDQPEIAVLRDELQAIGVRIHALPERSAGGTGALRRLRALTETIRGYPGCILHMHLTGHDGGDLVVAAGRLGGARAIIRTEHLPPMPPITARERRRVRLRDAFMDRVICVSEQTRHDHARLLGRNPRKLAAIPNCVDLQRFAHSIDGSDARAELGLAAEAPVIGTVSRMNEARKGLNYFVEMARRVLQQCPGAQFLLVGDGPLRPALEAQARELGIAERLVFTGARTDTPRLYAAMDVFVMPSLYEGGPITVLEAMAMAKPVVATPVGMVEDAIEDGVSGLIVPTADSTALANAVLQLLRDPARARQLGASGRQVVADRFSPAALVSSTAKLYAAVA